MINAISYETTRGGQVYTLAADKDMARKNAWHLRSVDGNGLPPVSTLGDASFGLPGRAYQGVTVGGREISADLYADGYSPYGMQLLLNEASRALTPGDEGLGVLRLENANGEVYRIAAKCTAIDQSQARRRSALCTAVFDCPFAYFESDTLFNAPLFAYTGGKEYPLTRPYTFGELTAGASSVTVDLMNPGDVAAPVVIKLFGAGLTSVEVGNQTTGAVVSASAMPSVNGIEISTDVNNLYARLPNGDDAMAYISLVSDLASFVLEPGSNIISVNMTATSVTAAGTEISYRGRYATCL